MKKLLLCSLAVVMITILTSCGKTDKVLVKNDGLWNIDKVTTVTETSGFPTTTDEETDNGTAEFRGDGTGTFTYPDGTSDEFTWEVSDDVITLEQSGFTFDYTILESSKSEQKWEYSETTDIGGFTSTITITIELSSI